MGGREGSNAAVEPLRRFGSDAYRRNVHRIRDALVAGGLREPTDLRFAEESDAIHHASAWARRLPDALRFLFGPESIMAR